MISIYKIIGYGINSSNNNFNERLEKRLYFVLQINLRKAYVVIM